MNPSPEHLVHVQTILIRAILHTQSREYDQALDELENLRGLLGNSNPDLYYNFGIVHRERGDSPSAMEAFGRAAAINQGDYDARYNEGVQALSLLQNGNSNVSMRAVQAFCDCWRMKPNVGAGVYNLTETVRNINDPNSIFDTLNHLSVLLKENPHLQENIVSNLSQFGWLSEFLQKSRSASYWMYTEFAQGNDWVAGLLQQYSEGASQPTEVSNDSTAP
jgi:tetratricopeptide (TPR) repeat protein